MKSEAAALKKKLTKAKKSAGKAIADLEKKGEKAAKNLKSKTTKKFTKAKKSARKAIADLEKKGEKAVKELKAKTSKKKKPAKRKPAAKK